VTALILTDNVIAGYVQAVVHEWLPASVLFKTGQVAKAG
jgi:hypothetical protein